MFLTLENEKEEFKLSYKEIFFFLKCLVEIYQSGFCHNTRRLFCWVRQLIIPFYESAYFWVCLLFCLFVCSFVCLFVCLFADFQVCLFVCRFSGLLVGLCWFSSLFACMCAYLNARLQKLFILNKKSRNSCRKSPNSIRNINSYTESHLCNWEN